MYYEHDLALVHARGFGQHADRCAPGVLGGVLAIDICDLEFGRVRAGEANRGLAGPDWAVITEFSAPAPDIFVRDVTTFVPDGAGAWRHSRRVAP